MPFDPFGNAPQIDRHGRGNLSHDGIDDTLVSVRDGAPPPNRHQGIIDVRLDLAHALRLGGDREEWRWRLISAALNGLPAIMWAAPPDGHIDFINRRWSEYTGLSFDEAGRMAGRDQPDDLPQVLQLWRSIVATGEPGEMEVRLRGFDGPYRRFLVHGRSLRDDCGRTVRWCGLFTDIEDIRRADEILGGGASSIFS